MAETMGFDFSQAKDPAEPAEPQVTSGDVDPAPKDPAPAPTDPIAPHGPMDPPVEAKAPEPAKAVKRESKIVRCKCNNRNFSVTLDEAATVGMVIKRGRKSYLITRVRHPSPHRPPLCDVVPLADASRIALEAFATWVKSNDKTIDKVSIDSIIEEYLG